MEQYPTPPKGAAMIKYPHKYHHTADMFNPFQYVSFKLEFDGQTYGHYEEFGNDKDKYRMLRSLVYTKQALLEDLHYVKNYREQQ